MTETTQLLEPARPFDGARILAFARSEMFERTFREGMGLVEEAASYLDGPGRTAARAMPRALALSYAGESMRLTTRLMQVASWLLVQRAVREGEMSLTDASARRFRLLARAAEPAHPVAELPEDLRALIARGEAIYERVSRLDGAMYANAAHEGANPVSVQHARLAAVFGPY